MKKLILVFVAIAINAGSYAQRAQNTKEYTKINNN